MLRKIILDVQLGKGERQSAKSGKLFTYVDFNSFLSLNREIAINKDTPENKEIKNFLYLAGVTDRDMDLASSLYWRLERLLVLGDIDAEDVDSVMGQIKPSEVKYMASIFISFLEYLQLTVMSKYHGRVNGAVNPSQKPLYLMATFISLIPLSEKHLEIHADGEKYLFDGEDMDGNSRIKVKGYNLITYSSEDEYIIHQFGRLKTSSTTNEELAKISGQFRYNGDTIIDGQEYFPIPYPKEILKEPIATLKDGTHIPTRDQRPEECVLENSETSEIDNNFNDALKF